MGTLNRDQKWLFQDMAYLELFLENFDINKAEVEFQVNKEGHFVSEIGVIFGTKSQNYWEEHITLLEIDTEKNPDYDKLFKAQFWPIFKGFVHGPSRILNDQWIINLRHHGQTSQ